MLAVIALSLVGAARAHSYYQPSCEGHVCFKEGDKATPYNNPKTKLHDACKDLPHVPNPVVALPKNDEENKAAYYECGYAYIGLTDIDHEGTFTDLYDDEVIYVHGGPSNGYTNFKHGQPNNYNGHQDVIRFTSDKKWTDVDNDEEHEVCCAYDNKRCDENHVCFALGPKRKCSDARPPASNLKPACEDTFGPEWQVAVPQSEAENTLAYKACGDLSFIGVMDLKGDGYSDHWFNLNDFSGVSIGDDCADGVYCNWESGQPNNNHHHITTFYDYKWYDVDLDNRYPVCCEKRPTEESEMPSVAPTPDPTANPTEPPSEAPTDSELCVDGIKNNFENVCCPIECGVCGGCDCSHNGDLSGGPDALGGPDFCCPGRIFENEIRCTMSSDVGCILDDYVPFDPVGCP